MARLLILSCSQRKRPGVGLLPAIDRYDGPAFRVLRKYLREDANRAPRVMVLSAKYGLIDASDTIRDYDLRMSAALARRLRRDVVASLPERIRASSSEVVGICLGRQYRLAVEGFEETLEKRVRVDWLEGGLGKRLTELHRWLRERAPLPPLTP